ncbi:zinc-binding dehydrogenase [Microbacterium sp. BWT-B31]|uniref:zinc-binding dehydrogenase n=1 Tax=Microbacterium sp. BWT-B31 TaxID=3232072 RepID=UPI003529AF11
MKGRVVVLKDYGAPFEIEEYDVPALVPGAVLVAVTQAGICGSDLHSWRGDRDRRLQPIPEEGCVMGHEGTGIVIDLGEGVVTDWAGKPVHEGDRVVHFSGRACFRCVQCGKGRPNLCTNPPGRYPAVVGDWPIFGGTYADYFYITPDRPFYVVPDGLKDESLSWVNCAMGTSAEGLDNASCGVGDHVVIQGAGGLGLCATALAIYRGAATVTVLDRVPERLALARRFGATHTIDVSRVDALEDRTAAVRDYTGQNGADIVMELVGVTELITEGVGYLAPGGTLVEIGHVMAGRAFTLDPRAIIRNKSILGSSGYRPQLLPGLMDLMLRTQDVVPYDEIVSHRFALADVNAAMDAAEWAGRSTTVTRAVLQP